MTGWFSADGAEELTAEERTVLIWRRAWTAIGILLVLIVGVYLAVGLLLLQVHDIRQFQDSGKVRGDKISARQCLVMESTGVDTRGLCDDPNIRALMKGNP